MCFDYLIKKKSKRKTLFFFILRNNNVDAVNERKRVASTSTLLNVYNHMWGRKKCDAVGSVGVVRSLLVAGCVEHVLSAAACFVQTLLI